MNSSTDHKQSRSFGLFLFLIGALTLLLSSAWYITITPGSLADFRHVFGSARCILEGSDPYSPAEMSRVYETESGERSSDSEDELLVATRYIYFPSEFIVTLPFALLPFSWALILWVALSAATFLFASYLVWNLSAEVAPELAGGLLCFVLANSQQILLYGNPAALATGLCLISVWCFLRDRYVGLGILCMVASLALKPHIIALIWLSFLLSRGRYCRRALMTMLIYLALSLPPTLWVANIAPNWLPELRSNWTAFTVHGGLNDPGPASYMHQGSGRMTNLQSLFSVFRDKPHFYNPATYVVFGLLLSVWIVVTLRGRPAPNLIWFALAAIVPISMLPMYHRIYDAKLIMLVIPACALLWNERDRLACPALIITTAAFVISGDLPWSVYLPTLIQLRLLTPQQPGPLISAALGFPLPIMMLVLAGFYLYVYARRASVRHDMARSTNTSTTLSAAN